MSFALHPVLTCHCGRSSASVCLFRDAVKRKLDQVVSDALVESASLSEGGASSVNPVRLLLREEFDLLATSNVLDAPNSRRVQAMLDKLRAIVLATNAETVRVSALLLFNSLFVWIMFAVGFLSVLLLSVAVH